MTLLSSSQTARRPSPPDLQETDRLVSVVAQLSLSLHLDDVMGVIRRTARKLTGADGVTFVLRENDLVYYAEEDAISPLWKGRRFPMNACISGWVIQNRKQAVIEDIYADPRIPHDAYRTTFVKSLMMAPIRRDDPVGAIGAYWAVRRRPSPEEVDVLQALADSTALALSNIRLYEDLEKAQGDLEERVRLRTAQLSEANERLLEEIAERRRVEEELARSNTELERFAYVASHDLQEPLRLISGYLQLLQQRYQDRMNEDGREFIRLSVDGAVRMRNLIDALLALSRVGSEGSVRIPVDLSAVFELTLRNLRFLCEQTHARVTSSPLPVVLGDESQMTRLLQNLIGNAVKFHGDPPPCVRLSAKRRDNLWEFAVEDNGIGIEPKEREAIFNPFHRLHGPEISGTGIGLSICKKIVERHGGRIWADSAPEGGSVFRFTLPAAREQERERLPGVG